MKKELNKYHTDSSLFFKEASRKINSKLTDFAAIQQALNFALGMERLLKGILFDINPTYVLIDPSFKNSAKLLYADKLLSQTGSSKEIADKPDGDVLTFRNTLARVAHFSKTAFKYKNTLYKLSEARDIIMHNELSYLNYTDLILLLQRDYYPMLRMFADELGVKIGHFFDGSHIKLSNLSSGLQDNLEDRVRLILETHLGKWKSLSGNPNFTLEKNSVTQEILNTNNKLKIICPACNNIAVLYLSPIYDLPNSQGDYNLVGYELKKMKCQYCKLEIKDAAYLDYLGLEAPSVEMPSTCAQCSINLPKDNSTGLCASCDEKYGTEN